MVASSFPTSSSSGPPSSPSSGGSSSPSSGGSSSPSSPGPLHIGTAGWAYADWKGIVYPTDKPRGWHALDLLTCYFNTVEVDTSFYRIPSGRSSAAWARRVAAHPDFLFTAKLWEGFTHRPDASASEGGFATREVEAFRAFVDPLVEAGRLGCLLAQFPWSFRPTPGNRDRLERLLDAFAAYPVAVEVRHADWIGDDGAGLPARLAERAVAFVNIDQPVFGGSLAPTEFVTADFFYVRFHGRNRTAWFDRDNPAHERYNYLYSPDELRPWIERIARMRTNTRRGFVIANNHYRGQAAANALELSSALGRPTPPAPESLARLYPAVRRLVSTRGTSQHAAPPPEQLDLFGL